MAKQADRHAALRTGLIDAAECTIAANGLAALKARDLAREAGCAVGTIYNIFEHLDELILCVGSRTLVMLDAALGAVRSASAIGSTEGAVDDSSSSSDKNRPAYPVARREARVSPSGSNPLLVISSGSRMFFLM